MPLIIGLILSTAAKAAHSDNGLDVNNVVQYTIVALLVLGACLWLLWSLRKQNRNKRSSCCGCALAQSCKSARKPRKSANPEACKK